MRLAPRGDSQGGKLTLSEIAEHLRVVALGFAPASRERQLRLVESLCPQTRIEPLVHHAR